MDREGSHVAGGWGTLGNTNVSVEAACSGFL